MHSGTTQAGQARAGHAVCNNLVVQRQRQRARPRRADRLPSPRSVARMRVRYEVAAAETGGTGGGFTWPPPSSPQRALGPRSALVPGEQHSGVNRRKRAGRGLNILIGGDLAGESWSGLTAVGRLTILRAAFRRLSHQDAPRLKSSPPYCLR